ncbi:MAG: FdtA/QdtA family cupin domain-containing protein [Lachnospiraceae bacterium]|nr:FdtA/QdtA family cupin domain-containing protein [Lachnospiraceae bacterium]
MNYKILSFEEHGDYRGTLISLEEMKNIPFDTKRVYFMFNALDDVRRGFHAHRHLKQVLVCTHGSCKIMLDDGKQKEDILLNEPSKGLYIESNLWREMYDFSKDAVLMVLASELYDEDDYIRNYDEFLTYVKEMREK